MTLSLLYQLFLKIRVDFIVCLDACFKQKSRKAQGKEAPAPRKHPDTAFVSSEDVKAMEDVVNEIRPEPKSSLKGKKSQDSSLQPQKDENPDLCEPGLKVPNSVLNMCGDSFTAADEKRVKASTQFFSDTGLMALLCRHDRVLWLVNMTSAGEKQHYALVLLERLFNHLPSTARVGVLYDIGCQLHRSCIKWGFLKAFHDRLIWAISVFHAYGHQWACQLIYHPRKCIGFGFTDGEGCERFWSSIKLLIPSLRVTGYYNRLYTLDTQVKHLDKKSLLNLGDWLRRKWVSMNTRKLEALGVLEELADLSITEDTLREEWAAQLVAQTKPMPRQSKNLADKLIEEIIQLKEDTDSCNKEIYKFEGMIQSGRYQDGWDVSEVRVILSELKEKCNKLERAYKSKREILGTDGRLRLDRLLGNKFLKVRINALALKKRLRTRLQQRKFELDGLERAYRKTNTNGML